MVKPNLYTVAVAVILAIVISCTSATQTPSAPRFQPSFHRNHHTFFATYISHGLFVRVPITANPEPSSYSLTLSGQPVHGGYTVAYKQQGVHQGTVTLTFPTVAKKNDLKSYVLTIHNGVGDGLAYSFKVDTRRDSDDNNNSNAQRSSPHIVQFLALVAILVVAREI